jgi:hypothetical protein
MQTLCYPAGLAWPGSHLPCSQLHPVMLPAHWPCRYHGSPCHASNPASRQSSRPAPAAMQSLLQRLDFCATASRVPDITVYSPFNDSHPDDMIFHGHAPRQFSAIFSGLRVWLMFLRHAIPNTLYAINLGSGAPAAYFFQPSVRQPVPACKARKFTLTATRPH